ncbi:MAG TPA: YsnF/AvaK domain-containing protein [Gemmatimonadales bacterium]|nr:YsnF/AvaK domain-containing protein [Gemmatimonadales bacterium]
MTARNESIQTIVGLFTERRHAEQAILDLKAAGFGEDQIGVAMQDRDEQQSLIEDTGSQAAEGAAKGAVSGGIVGGLIGLLGSLLIPGLGPIVVGGVLASTLTGAGIGAATGGLIGALIGLGVPEEDARHFDQGLRSGGILVTVNAAGRADEAGRILHSHGADLGPSAVGRYEDTGVQGTAGVGATGAGSVDADRQRLELREEELDVDKRRVQAGEVRVRKEVVTEQRNIEVPVSREEVVIERRPASGRETASDIDAGEEIRIPLMEDQVQVDKHTRVREELEVGKRRVDETRTVSDEVRREEARIDTAGEAAIVPGTGSRTNYQGKERRRRRDRSYVGPERRATV